MSFVVPNEERVFRGDVCRLGSWAASGIQASLHALLIVLLPERRRVALRIAAGLAGRTGFIHNGSSFVWALANRLALPQQIGELIFTDIVVSDNEAAVTPHDELSIPHFCLQNFWVLQ